MSGDPYAALGVAKTAAQEDIKKAYKKIARESHPDLNPCDPAAEARFKAAASAWELLKDPEKRGRFDRGEIDASGQETPERRFYREYAEGPEATYHTNRGYEDFQGYSDVFEDLFGARRGRPGGGAQGGFRMRGPDAHYSLEVGFLDAAKGATKRITLPGGGTLDGKLEPAQKSGKRAVVIVAPSLDRRELVDAERQAETLIAGLPGLTDIKLASRRRVEIARMEAIEIVADAKDEKGPIVVYQMLILPAGGGYYRIVGQMPVADKDVLLPEMRRIAEGFRVVE